MDMFGNEHGQGVFGAILSAIGATLHFDKTHIQLTSATIAKHRAGKH